MQTKVVSRGIKSRGLKVLTISAVLVALTALTITIIPKGLKITYEGVSEAEYAPQVEQVLKLFPNEVINSMKRTGVKIHITSGLGKETVEETIDGVYQGSKSTILDEEHSTALGFYEASNNEIYIFTDNIENFAVRGQSLKSTLCHEIGHYMYFYSLTEEERKTIQECFKSGEAESLSVFVTDRHVALNHKEYFAKFIEYYLYSEFRGSQQDWGTPITLSIVEKYL